MGIKEHLEEIRKTLPAGVKLIAVSKTHPAEEIIELYDCGQRIFGENRVQELTAKQPVCPGDIEWHFIGHLQTNKVKYIAPFVSVIHSTDSLNLLQEINKEAAKNNRVIDCLLEMYIATEETKFGLSADEAIAIIQSAQYAAMENVRICGLMGMASFTDDTALVRSEFNGLKNVFDTIKKLDFKDKAAFAELSMGMSSDYRIAIEEGSTIVRLGTVLFGKRNYK
ncbi:MAG: YggS family pyridoxal phosphate-dependent enzyme [Bacteroidota bacterium]